MPKKHEKFGEGGKNFGDLGCPADTPGSESYPVSVGATGTNGAPRRPRRL
jgi:hypothetical protein